MCSWHGHTYVNDFIASDSWDSTKLSSGLRPNVDSVHRKHQAQLSFPVWAQLRPLLYRGLLQRLVRALSFLSCVVNLPPGFSSIKQMHWFLWVLAVGGVSPAESMAAQSQLLCMCVCPFSIPSCTNQVSRTKLCRMQWWKVEARESLDVIKEVSNKNSCLKQGRRQGPTPKVVLWFLHKFQHTCACVHACTGRFTSPQCWNSYYLIFCKESLTSVLRGQISWSKTFKQLLQITRFSTTLNSLIFPL